MERDMTRMVKKVVNDLARKALTTLPRPLTEDVIDDVLSAIEKSIDVKQYRNLCEHFGKKTVNQQIGRAVKDALTPEVVGRVKSEKNTLSKTYSKLKFVR